MAAQPNVLIFDTAEELAEAAADKFAAIAEDAYDKQCLFSVALSGGNTPRRMYQLLAGKKFSERIVWSETAVFFVDERCVPHDHPDSNYRMTKEELLSKVGVRPKDVRPVAGEGDPTANAKIYEEQMRSFFVGMRWPRFDLVLLGLGADGHTASLFPGTSALDEKTRWVRENFISPLNAYRITLTAPAINHSSNIMFLVSGEEKAASLAAVLKGPREPNRLPAQLIQPENGSLLWLVDRPAASQLSE